MAVTDLLPLQIRAYKRPQWYCGSNISPSALYQWHKLITPWTFLSQWYLVKNKSLTGQGKANAFQQHDTNARVSLSVVTLPTLSTRPCGSSVGNCYPSRQESGSLISTRETFSETNRLRSTFTCNLQTTSDLQASSELLFPTTKYELLMMGKKSKADLTD